MASIPAWGAALLLAAVLSPRLGPLSLADLLAAAGAAWHWRALRRAPLPPALAWSAAAWVAAGALSSAWALAAGYPERPDYVVLVSLRRLEVVLALFAGAAVAAAGGGVLLRGTLLFAVQSAGAIGILDRLFPFYWMNERLSPETSMRAFERGLYQWQANHFAYLFAIALPLTLALALGPGSGAPTRRAAVLALLLGGGGLLATGSRVGVLAAALGLTLTAALLSRRTLLAAVAIGALVGLCLPAEMERRYEALLSGESSALADRARNWVSAADAFRAHPLLGVGPGTRNLAFYDSELLMALEGGGLLGALVTTAGAIALVHALAGRRRPGASGALAAAALVSTLSSALHIGRVAVPLALLAGALAAGIRNLDESPEPGHR